MSKNQELIKKFNNSIFNNKKLSNYSWFNLGGPAEYFFKPTNKSQLIKFLKENKKNKLKITVLGAGSNTLIRDNGIKGVVIKLSSNFSKLKILNKNIIEVGAATLDRKVADFAKNNGIGGFEFLACIPGSLGGAIVMNSGCYGNDISQKLISVNGIDADKCKEIEINREDIKFFYRGTNLSKQFIVTSVKLKGENISKSFIEKKQKEMVNKKKSSQPSQVKTCGSTFKNIDSKKKAWELIKETGCDQFKEGDAIISEKHCNFFVNKGKAKSADIEKLINRVKKSVSDKTGVNLELEIKIIGE